jgi:hypothetical protein
MPDPIPPPTDVITLVFLAWTAGVMAIGSVTRLWGEVDAGHFKVVWLTGSGLGLAAGFGYRPAWIAATASLLTFAAIYWKGRDREAGIVAAVIAVAVLAWDAPPYALATAALMGAVSNAMLLGHWHLNQPRLGTGPIKRVVWMLWGGLAAFGAASGWMLMEATGIRLTGAVAALSLGALVAFLTAMVHHLVGTRSIMSATGILYLEVLLCIVGVFMGSMAALA